MSNKVHCDICDEIIKGKSIPETFICFFDWYEFKRCSFSKGLIHPFGPDKNKMTVCNNCFTEFREFVLKKKSYAKS